ncbi:MAG: hypothetical protein HC765_03350 [Brachymonas sp.]|nr:hypothetical protein [Brachymonas sp.]
MTPKTVSIHTDQGVFNVHLMGEHGSWLICWPAQLNDHTSLLDFAGQLVRHHRIVLIDPTAMGSNQHLPYSSRVEDHLPFALSLFRGLGMEQCHWVGHGAGGVLGAALAVAARQRIQSLTLASTPMLKQGRFKLSAQTLKSMLSGFRLGRRILVKRGMEQLGYADTEEKKLVTRHLYAMFERTAPQTHQRHAPTRWCECASDF